MSQPQYTVQAEAERIFRDILLKDTRLGLPEQVLDLALSTRFDSTAISQPFIPCPLKFSESSSALWALASTYANAICKERYQIDQSVTINSDVASLFLMSTALVRVDGKTLQDPELAKRYMKYDLGQSAMPWRRLCTNIYPTKDGRYFHLHGSMDATATLDMLGLPTHDTSLSVSESIEKYSVEVAKHSSRWLDIESNDHHRQAGTICYTPDEYLRSEQGQAMESEPIYNLEQFIDDTIPPSPWPRIRTSTLRPLEGVKMIDISRVIAGPTIAKLAALYGAAVIRVSCSSQPDMGPLLVEGNLGKRDVSIDLKSKEGRKTLERLLADADVLLDGYRPGALEKLGFGPNYVHEIGRRRGKGFVYVRENCYGWKGPLSSRSGWQQISDCLTGASWLMGQFLGLDEPVVPLLPNSDYQTGLIGLVGILNAIDRRSKEGGNYLLSLSLTQYNQFLLSLGTYAPDIQAALRKQHSTLSLRSHDDMISLVGKTLGTLMKEVPQLFDPKHFQSLPSKFGLEKDEMLTFLGPAASFTETVLHYDIGSCFLNSYEAEWPESLDT